MHSKRQIPLVERKYLSFLVIIVLGGVTIGDNTVIAAGVPCRVLRKITEADKYPHYTGD